jgi:phosphohistidine phosphatase SixA
MNYRDIHDALQEQRGSASEQACVSCGGAAQEWAYRYNGEPEVPRTANHGPCSEDLFGCYQPMCVSCHRHHDIENDPWLSMALQENGRRLAAVQAERLRSEPEFAAKRRQLGRQVGLLPAGPAVLESLKKARATQTPEAMKERGEHMGRTHAERLKNDPEYAEQHREYSRRNARKRRRCSCGLVSHPPGVARHQKSTNHEGYEDL